MADQTEVGCVPSRNPAGPLETRRMAGLDGLRGVAALLVVGGHLTGQIVAVTGVYLFFILSSFLLMSQFLRWRPADFLNLRRWGHYALRRSARVLPLFMLVACVSALTTALAPGWMKGIGFPITVEPSELAGVMTMREGPGVLWSIPVEFKFYLVLPAAAALVIVVLRGWLWGGAMLLGGLAVAAGAWFEPAHHGLSVWPFLALFLTGCLAAVLHRLLETALAEAGPATSARRWALEGTGWLMLLGWALTMPLGQKLLLGVGLDRNLFIVSHGLFAVLFGTLVLTVLHGRGVLRWLLDRAWMRWVGAVSFSLYLWHTGPIQAFDAWGVHPKLGGILAIVVSLVLSGVTYRWFERPILEATKHWLRPAEARQRPAATAGDEPAVIADAPPRVERPAA